eukprot:3999379-Prymnesium_polylepis.1
MHSAGGRALCITGLRAGSPAAKRGGKQGTSPPSSPPHCGHATVSAIPYASSRPKATEPRSPDSRRKAEPNAEAENAAWRLSPW